jgi:hypothetical protein
MSGEEDNIRFDVKRGKSHDIPCQERERKIK